jgi:hypothetical protein
MSLDPTVGERAAAALDAYWMRVGFPVDHSVITSAHAAIKDRLGQGYGKNWQALLDDALSDIGCTIDWDGQRVRSITTWGASARSEAESHELGRKTGRAQ